MTTHYTALDAAIIESLRQSPKHFTLLHSGTVQAEADAFAEIVNSGKSGYSIKPAFRFVDTRLQALRKAGKILHNTKTGWQLS